MRRLALAATGLIIAGLLVNPGADAGSRPTWKVGADDVDRLVGQTWSRHRITPAPAVADLPFVRRVTLDLIGRVPTVAEVDQFMASSAETRRAALVDRLLASDEYVDHWTDVYVGLFLGQQARLAKHGDQPRVYFERSLRENRPWDQVAAELITAAGPVEPDGDGSFVLAHRVRGLEIEQLATQTARLFLGVRIECAQCHDHPYEPTLKKRDFAAFAAFYGDTRLRPLGKGPYAWEIIDLPADRVRNPKKKLHIEPRFLGRDVTFRDGESRRQALARAVIDSDLFAKAMVNRTWQQFFGAAISAPWDDLRRENHPDHPALLGVLADYFVASGYDHKRLVKAIVLSRTYGRSSTGGHAPTGAAALEEHFARARVRPLSADQLLRSQLLATGLADPQTLRHVHGGHRASSLREYLLAFGDDEGGEADAFTGSIPQALLLLNGRIVTSGSRARDDLTLGRILTDHAEAGARIRAMCRVVYSRPPTRAELTRWREYIAGREGATEAYEDLFHALLSSTEFVTNH